MSSIPTESNNDDSRRLVIDMSREDGDSTLIEMGEPFDEVVDRRTRKSDINAGKRKLNGSQNEDQPEGCSSVKKQNLGNRNLSDDQMRRGNGLVVYVKGYDINIAKIRADHMKAEILKTFGEVNRIELARESLRIYCKDTNQRSQILKSEHLGKVRIVASEPYFAARRDEGTSARMRKGVIYGVPTDLTENEIAEELALEKVERLNRVVNGA